MTISEERRRQLSRAGRLGGLRRWIRHPEARHGVMDNAQQTFRRSFLLGHGCAACGDYVALDRKLPDDRRRALAERLRRFHYQRLAERAVAARRKNG